MPDEVPPRIQHLEREADARRKAAHDVSPVLVDYVDIKHDVQRARTEWFASINRVLIERYGKYASFLLGGLAVTLVALGVVSFVLVTREGGLSKRQHQADVAQATRNCRNNARLAQINRAYIGRTEEQTRGLLEHGITFGIPKALIPSLIQRDKENSALFLHDLDVLATQNCAPPEVKHPERKAFPRTKAKPQPPILPPPLSPLLHSAQHTSPRASIAPPVKHQPTTTATVPTRPPAQTAPPQTTPPFTPTQTQTQTPTPPTPQPPTTPLLPIPCIKLPIGQVC